MNDNIINDFSRVKFKLIELVLNDYIEDIY
jgi:hypothetical protein